MQKKNVRKIPINSSRAHDRAADSLHKAIHAHLEPSSAAGCMGVCRDIFMLPIESGRVKNCAELSFKQDGNARAHTFIQLGLEFKIFCCFPLYQFFK